MQNMEYVGAQIGNYRLRQLLGKGGFAHVYLGEHTSSPTQQSGPLKAVIDTSVTKGQESSAVEQVANVVVLPETSTSTPKHNRTISNSMQRPHVLLQAPHIMLKRLWEMLPYAHYNRDMPRGGYHELPIFKGVSLRLRDVPVIGCMGLLLLYLFITFISPLAGKNLELQQVLHWVLAYIVYMLTGALLGWLRSLLAMSISMFFLYLLGLAHLQAWSTQTLLKQLSLLAVVTFVGLLYERRKSDAFLTTYGIMVAGTFILAFLWLNILIFSSRYILEGFLISLFGLILFGAICIPPFAFILTVLESLLRPWLARGKRRA